MMPGSELEIENLGLNPTRTHFLHVLRSAGADIEIAARMGGLQRAGRDSFCARQMATARLESVQWADGGRID